MKSNLNSRSSGPTKFCRVPVRQGSEFELGGTYSKQARLSDFRMRQDPHKRLTVEFTVFDLAETAIILTADERLVSKEPRFAADQIMHVLHPSAADIKAPRVIAGRPQTSNEVASDLAFRPQNIVIAALLRRNLRSAHLQCWMVWKVHFLADRLSMNFQGTTQSRIGRYRSQRMSPHGERATLIGARSEVVRSDQGRRVRERPCLPLLSRDPAGAGSGRPLLANGKLLGSLGPVRL